jgi:hypothetical protein
MNINKIGKNITRILTFEKKINYDPLELDSAPVLGKDLQQDSDL